MSRNWSSGFELNSLTAGVEITSINGTLSYWLGGAGTANITIQYWQST